MKNDLVVEKMEMSGLQLAVVGQFLVSFAVYFDFVVEDFFCDQFPCFLASAVDLVLATDRETGDID